jgi:K(+)-stimulated pyrophosphate-energized sodium pump
MIVWTILALVLSVAALAWAVNLQKQIMREDEGNETMKGIARQIQDGAMAFLKTEYKWLSLFVIIVAAVNRLLLRHGHGPDGRRPRHRGDHRPAGLA